jgi:hypothetical protein
MFVLANDSVATFSGPEPYDTLESCNADKVLALEALDGKQEQLGITDYAAECFPTNPEPVRRI